MIDLLPCPFCGGEAVEDAICCHGVTEFIRCKLCGVRTDGFDEGPSAARAWNRRTS
jgi:Lar family restriction alleviation protein